MSFKPYRDREDIEWTNTWVEACLEPNKPRMLLIGDSVTRELRSEMSTLYPKYAFDYIGTSSSFDDPCFYNVFEAFFKNNFYKYNQIFCNIGAKHCWYINTVNRQEDSQRYEKNFSKFIKYIKKRGLHVVILLTPPNRLAEDVQKWDDEKNKEIKNRNKIQSKVAEREKIITIDLYDMVMKKQYAYRDNYHFLERQTSQELVKNIFKAVGKLPMEINITCKLFGFIPLFSIKKK